MKYGYREYIDIDDVGNLLMEQQVIQNAIETIKSKYKVDIKQDSCKIDYDYLDGKTTYSVPVHTRCEDFAFDNKGNYIGMIGFDIQSKLKIGIKVYMND